MTKEKLRERFKKQFINDDMDDLSFNELLDDSADFWLNILEEELNNQKQSIIEKVEKMKKTENAWGIWKGYNQALDSVLELIKEEKI